jgi:hypothetical protein
MRNNIVRPFLLTLLPLCIFASCSKDKIIDNANQVGISKVTYYATFAMAGSPYMSIVKGQTFQDPGVTATQNGASLTVTVDGTVNNAQVGIYIITYSAVNSDGYAASTSRQVAVLPSAELAGVDLSGTYQYVPSPATTSTITKLAAGFYATSNCWSSATTIACEFICSDGVNITMPVQSTPYGDLNGTGTLSPTGALTYFVSIPSQGLNGVERDWQAK